MIDVSWRCDPFLNEPLPRPLKPPTERGWGSVGVATFKLKMGNVVEDDPLVLEHNTEDAAKDQLDHEASLN